MVTLIELTQLIKKSYPSADTAQIFKVINELEYRISEDILKPAGLPHRTEVLNENDNQNTALIIGDGYLTIYTSYVFAFLAMLESDFETANAHSALFNEKYSELATEIRRKYLPISNTYLNGGMLL